MSNHRAWAALGLVVIAAAAGTLWFVNRTDPTASPVPSSQPAAAIATPGAAAAAHPAKREPAARSGGGMVIGSVRVFGTEKPVGGATLTLTADDVTLEGRSLDDGSFSFSGVPRAESWTLHVSTAGAGEATLAGLVVPERRTTSVGTVYLAPGFEFPGIVEDEAGAPVPGATVAVLEPREKARGLDLMAVLRDLGRHAPAAHTTQSGADGRFLLAGLPPGTYTVVARKPGFAAAVHKNTDLTPRAGAEPLRLVLGAALRIEGRVVRTGDGPVAGLTVVAFGAADMFDLQMPRKSISRTDEQGAFVLDGVAEGSWSVACVAEGEAMTIESGVAVPQVAPLEIRIGGPATLSGRVTGSGDSPVAGARVLLGMNECAAHTLTDADGRYVLRGLPAGPAEIFIVQADGYCPHPPGGPSFLRGGSDEAPLTAGANTRDVKLVAGGKVRGVVVEEGTQTPVPGAVVSVMTMASFFGGAPSATTGADGKFEIAAVPVGASNLTVRKDGWCEPPGELHRPSVPFGLDMQPVEPDEKDAGSGSKLVIHEQGAVVERTVVLVRAPVLTGRVTDASGAAVSGTRVAVKAADGSGMDMLAEISEIFGGGAPAARFAAADGTFAVTAPVAKGKVKLTASAPGCIDAESGEVEVGGATPPAAVEIKLGRGGVLEGRVTGPDGRPVEGAAVSWHPHGADDIPELRELKGGADGRSARTDGSGAFRMQSVVPGRLEVHVRHPRHVAAHRTDLTAVEGETLRCDVTLAAGLSITGRAVGPDGKPVREAWIEVKREETPDEEESAPRTVAGKDGMFHVDGLAPGRYRLTAHRFESLSSGGVDSDPVVVEAGAAGVELRLRAPMSIAGSVRFKDGTPAAGVEVRAVRAGRDELSSGAEAKTAADGTFRVVVTRRGEYTLVVSEGAVEQGAPRTNLRPARVKGVAAGTENVLVEVEPGLTITGRVLAPDGSPVTAGTVTARTVAEPPGGAADETEADVGCESPIVAGAFEVMGLGKGGCVLVVEVEGLPTVRVKAAAGARDLVVHMPRGGTIKGRVVLPDGKPAADAWVTIEDGGEDGGEDEDSDQPTEFSAEDGTFTLKGVAPGVHRVTADFDDDEGDNWLGEVKGVEVRADQTTEGIEIRLKKTE